MQSQGEEVSSKSTLTMLFTFPLFTHTPSRPGDTMARYFDPHDIMCEEQRVKVRFLQDVPWLGSLSLAGEDASSCLSTTGPADENCFMTAGAIVQMPLWMARALAATGVLQIIPVRQYGVRVRADLMADPLAVSLRDLCPYWYALGTKLATLLPNESLGRLMRSAFSGRLPLLARASFYAGKDAGTVDVDPHQMIFGGTTAGARQLLDHQEQIIYQRALDTRRDAAAWGAGEGQLIRPAYDDG